MNKRPVRLQLSRRKGFRLQAHSLAINGLPAVKVDRSTRYGNPFRVGDKLPGMPGVRMDAEDCVRCFQLFTLPQFDRAWLDALRGKNIACWCALDSKWCHGDVLLKAADARTRRPILAAAPRLRVPTASARRRGR